MLELTKDYVLDEAAQEIAQKYSMTYFKTSAYNGENIEEMIDFTFR